MQRRHFLYRSLAVTGTVIGSNSISWNVFAEKGNKKNISFELPPLAFSYEALEPYIDKLTMEIHYIKHHGAYVKNLNKELETNKLLNGRSIEQICKEISKYNLQVRNNAGGHYNHSLFWKLLTPATTSPSVLLLKAIEKEFGDLEKFKNQFSDVAKNRFGSGWAWLVYQKGKLILCSTPNQDNPLMDINDIQGFPLMGLDVWEHAYYLKYQNRRIEYIDAFWKILNWTEVNNRYEQAIQMK